MTEGFNTDNYLRRQYSEIKRKIDSRPNHPTYIEFGGKPGDDQHAARVLPGYRADCKVELLRSLIPNAKIVMVVNSRDILLPEHGRYQQSRIRGDSQLFYGEETIRLIDKLDGQGLKPAATVLSVSPLTKSTADMVAIGTLKNSVEERGIEFYEHFEIPGYPDTSILEDPHKVFAPNDTITNGAENLVVFSPGGGSGKFGVILSEIVRAFQRGLAPTFVKFETFPVFNLEERHPLNLAFEAATADLLNKVTAVNNSQGEKITTYDKDIENFNLLKTLFSRYSPDRHHPIISDMTHPSDMGVNVLESGITNMDIVVEAAKKEILRRYVRYIEEEKRNIEQSSTVIKVRNLLLEIGIDSEV